MSKKNDEPTVYMTGSYTDPASASCVLTDAERNRLEADER